ncbi:MAG TPA: autoinducer binding domain-containing protein [Bauldia sp.]|nr:autoinducer binding domain-containing protein [Bauldia sp.]
MPRETALADILRATSVAACVAVFRAALDALDIDTFSCGELDLRHRSRSIFHVIDWPPDWQRFYFSSGLVERDPVVENLARYDRPFTWADLRADRRLAQVGQDGLERVAAAGWIDGLVVPIPRGGPRYGLVSLVARRHIDEAGRRALGPLALCFHARVLPLVRHEGFAVPPAGLTPREIECLGLVVRGGSDRMIAAELGISLATAHEHVERAKRRLTARTRAELAAVAVSLGIVDI